LLGFDPEKKEKEKGGRKKPMLLACSPAMMIMLCGPHPYV
jgi:hypothetical protein